MTIQDPMTAALVAERMVNSFFKGLTESEVRYIVFGGAASGGLSPAFSMLAYTLDVFLGELSLSEEQGREIFKAAVQKKIVEMRSDPKLKEHPENRNLKK
jgi:hypothetical protein